VVARRTLRRALAVAALGISAAVIAVVAFSSSTSSSAVSSVHRLPASPASGLRVPTPIPLRRSAVAYWASVRRPAFARAAPSDQAPIVTPVADTTPDDTTNIVLVLGRTRDREGRLWVRVRLAVLPNNRTGWVPRRALGVYGVVQTHLLIDLERLAATLLRDGRPVFHAPIGVGAPQWPTPKGDFYIRDKLTKYSSPFYGPLAFGTSARSSVLTDWPGGGFVGIHGTDAPELLPGRVSHGCIRLRNEDMLELGRLLPVGTPLTIR
jgi:lipoprotein-anchoring transpeptidase ErfK/SrfK